MTIDNLRAEAKGHVRDDKDLVIGCLSVILSREGSIDHVDMVRRFKDAGFERGDFLYALAVMVHGGMLSMTATMPIAVTPTAKFRAQFPAHSIPPGLVKRMEEGGLLKAQQLN